MVLWGLCDAASAALLYLEHRPDPRVAGLALANPWVRSAASLARTHVRHYYGRRLLQPEFWLKLLRGGVGANAVKGLLRNVKASREAAPEKRSFQQRMAAGWRRTAAPILLMLSGADYTAKEFLDHAGNAPDWAELLGERRVSRVDFPDADHTFSDGDQAQRMVAATHRWLHDIASSP